MHGCNMQYANTSSSARSRLAADIPFPLEERRLRIVEAITAGNSQPTGYVNAPWPAPLVLPASHYFSPPLDDVAAPRTSDGHHQLRGH